MTSESPGVSSSRNKNPLRRETNPRPRDVSQCLDRNNLAIPRARQSPLLVWALLTLIISCLAATVGAEGFCDPLLCSCQLSSANCSWRGLLTLPSGLHDNIKSLDLSNNDIQQINKTDLALYSNLEVLDLSRNKINTFQGRYFASVS